MTDPHEVDSDAVLRRQIEQTLRFMALSTLVGLIVIVVIAVAVPSIRGVMILVGIVYLVSSLTARWYLRRRFMSRLATDRPARRPSRAGDAGRAP
ncbi:MAG TPA: hypothetical protein VHB53_10320 [Solirubrobacterales bacterium]|nr:hypothetical protein [Solirubrobacterales bacterium]